MNWDGFAFGMFVIVAAVLTVSTLILAAYLVLAVLGLLCRLLKWPVWLLVLMILVGIVLVAQFIGASVGSPVQG